MSPSDLEVYGDADVIESPPRRPLPRWAGVAAVVLAVLLAAGAGYLAGRRNVDSAAPPPRHPSTAVPIVFTGNRCSEQLGPRDLQLGIELANQGSTVATVQQIQAILPMNGLHVTANARGSCGQLPGALPVAGAPIPPGGTAWVTMSFGVLAVCPAPLPVQFTLDYTVAGKAQVLNANAFPDLGDIPYATARCANG